MRAHRRARARRLRQHRRRATCSPTWCRSTRPSPGSSRTGARWRRRPGRGASGAHARRARSPPRTALRARALLAAQGLARPPAAGRPPPQRRARRQAVAGRALARGGARGCSASSGPPIVLTGSAADRRAGGARSRAGCRGAPLDLTGRLAVRETLAVIGAPRPVPLPGHRAHAHGLRGGHAVGERLRPLRSARATSPAARRARHAPRGGAPRAVVLALQPDPPAARRSARPTTRPECLRLVTVDDVYAAAARLLLDGGFARRRRARREDARPLGRRRRGAARARRARARARAWDASGAARARRGRASPIARGRRPEPRSAQDADRRGGHAPGRRTGAGGPCWTAAASASCSTGRASRSGGSPSCTSTTRRDAPALRARHRDLPPRCSTREAPDEVEAVGLAPEDTLLLARTCTARGVLFHGRRAGARGCAALRARRAVAASSRWNTVKALADRGSRPRLAGPPPAARRDGRRTVLFLSHAAFWRERARRGDGAPRAYEHYFDRADPRAGGRGRRCGRSWCAVGPRAAFRRRGAARARSRDWLRLRGRRRAVRPRQPLQRRAACCARRGAATREVRRGWRALRGSPARARGLLPPRRAPSPTWREPDLAAHAAAAAALGGALATRRWRRCSRAVRPAVVCLYAESSGWGRAALAACRAAGVPTRRRPARHPLPEVLLLPPRPPTRRTARGPTAPRVFGEAARRLLVRAWAATRRSRLVVTGSPQVRRAAASARATCDRAALRARPGRRRGRARCWWWPAASAASASTHQSIGSAFPAPGARGGARSGVRCLVKPHPAEPAERLRGAIRGSRRAARTRAVPRAPTSCDAAPRRRRAGHRGVALRGGGAGAGPAGGDPQHAHQPARRWWTRGWPLGRGRGRGPARRRCGAALFDADTRGRASPRRARALPRRVALRRGRRRPPRASWTCCARPRRRGRRRAGLEGVVGFSAMRPDHAHARARAQVGEGQPCFVLAEVASAHGGSADAALRDAGGRLQDGRGRDQVPALPRRAPGRAPPSRAQGLRPDRARRAKEWQKVLRAAKASGLALLAEAFDRPSLELAAGGGRRRATRSTPPTWRTRSSSARWASVGRPVLSPPAACPRTRCARRSTSRARRRWACCTASRPSPPRSRRSASASSRPGRSATACRSGFLDHTDGGSAFALVAPALAVAYGADLVEKHFTLDRSEKGYDYQSSLNPEDFYRMVELLRQAERAAGDGPPRRERGRAALPPR